MTVKISIWYTGDVDSRSFEVEVLAADADDALHEFKIVHKAIEEEIGGKGTPEARLTGTEETP